MAFVFTLVMALAVLGTGCYTTNHVTMKASSHYEYGTDGKGGLVDGNPAYYLLVPLTIPYDLIMAPARGIIYLNMMSGDWGDGSGSH